MFFTKFPYRRNFDFITKLEAQNFTGNVAGREITFSIDHFEGNLSRLSVQAQNVWPEQNRIAPIIEPDSASSGPLQLSADGLLQLLAADDRIVLESLTNEVFGLCGEQSMWQFRVPRDSQYYGMGEKYFGRLELSGIRTKFWNTDVWADFHHGQWENHGADPTYFSTPYLILKTGSTWIGILLDNPWPAFMETPGLEDLEEESLFFLSTNSHLIFGNEGGSPVVWFAVAESIRELTRTMQGLIGAMPVPPLWALGYHQCRWGYSGEEDLLRLDKEFDAHQIPVSALWLDIDYMDGFRVFSFDDEQFSSGVNQLVALLKTKNRKVVPILDPGVKFGPGESLYEEGAPKNVFCKNDAGRDFVGLVWPGETVYPDFSTEAGRTWWSGHVTNFLKYGFDGVWIDMNDPATGHVDPIQMRFDSGRLPHAAARNEYALGMHRATYEGFLEDNPNRRPFILSRSGFTGTSRYGAIWTGDNVSNYFYLRTSIATSLNLSLSGLAMNGPDVGGFGGNATEQLMVDWVKACFLFPFFRNHSVKGSSEQEPWQFSEAAIGHIRRYIRLRYKLLPYLYNLFIDHELLGDPVLRPVFYEFPDMDAKWHNLPTQFMVGPSILQAPIVEGEHRIRDVFLPKGARWYDDKGEWLSPSRYRVEADRGETPIFIREGAIIPMQREVATDASVDLLNVDFHIYASTKWSGESSYTYRADDGESFDYRKGVRSEIKVAARGEGTTLHLEYESVSNEFGEITPEFVVHGEYEIVMLNGKAAEVTPDRFALTGRPYPVLRIRLN